MAIDNWLLTRIFTPLAAWIDHWLHINHYRLARWCMIVSYISGIVCRFGHIWRDHLIWFDYLGIALLGLVVVFWAYHLQKASDQWERGSNALPSMSYISMPWPWRVMMMGTNIIGIPGDVVMIIAHPWATPVILGADLFTMGVYFAAVVLPRRPRHSWQIVPAGHAQGAGA